MIEGIIYRYISPSGKSYIGQTTNEVYRRRMWFGKGRYTGGRSKIDRARKKYGPENFMYEVLLRNQYSGIEAATLDLNKWETYYIGYYDTYKNGYNSTLGGDGSRGYIQSVEALQKISKSLKGRKKPNGFGSRVSSSLKGIAKSVEHRKKLSESKKNSGHKILQYSLTGEYIKTWDNIDEVAKTLGVSRESIAGCCRGKSKTAHKFIWKYK
jgi:group I intron endonuclease